MRVTTRLVPLTSLLFLLLGPGLSASTVASIASGQAMRFGQAPWPAAWPWLALAGLAVGMAIRIKDTAALSQKFVQRASAATGDYTSGVQQAGQDWETGARNGETNYEQGVQEAISKKRFGRGIAAAGAQKYTNNAVKLGAQRYTPGIQNAQDAWARGVAPALEKLKGLTLPPRGPRRSPQNQQRANMVAMELGKLVDGQ